MRPLFIIFEFEYIGYIKNKIFRNITIALILVALFVTFLPRIKAVFWGSGYEDKKSAVLILSEEMLLNNMREVIDADALSTIAPDYKWDIADAKENSQKLIEDDKYAVRVLYDNETSYTIYSGSSELGLGKLIPVLNDYLTKLNQERIMRQLSGSEQIGADKILHSSVSGNIQTMGANSMVNGYWLAMLLLVLLFFAIIVYGQFVITSVINEKSSRTMELLITSAKPTHLIIGKVMGVGCAALTQLLLLIVTMSVGILINHREWINVSSTDEIIMASDFSAFSALSEFTAVLFLLFFLGGYFLYAFINAAVGSTVSKVEDSGSVSALPQVFILIVFVISFHGIRNLDTVYAEILSYIPLFSPFIMFARVCLGDASYMQALIALIFLAAAVLLFSWIAAKIYELGVMMYGKPTKPIEIIRLLVKNKRR